MQWRFVDRWFRPDATITIRDFLPVPRPSFRSIASIGASIEDRHGGDDSWAFRKFLNGNVELEGRYLFCLFFFKLVL